LCIPSYHHRYVDHARTYRYAARRRSHRRSGPTQTHVRPVAADTYVRSQQTRTFARTHAHTHGRTEAWSRRHTGRCDDVHNHAVARNLSCAVRNSHGQGSRYSYTIDTDVGSPLGDAVVQCSYSMHVRPILPRARAASRLLPSSCVSCAGESGPFQCLPSLVRASPGWAVSLPHATQLGMSSLKAQHSHLRLPALERQSRDSERHHGEGRSRTPLRTRVLRLELQVSSTT